MRAALLVATMALVSVAAAQRVALPSLLHDEAHHTPSSTYLQGWTSSSLADRDHELLLTLALRAPNEAAIERLYWERSTPSSPDYGKWLTPSELRAISGPSSAELAPLRVWLSSMPSVRVEELTTGEALRVRGPASAISALFGGVSFSQWKHAAYDGVPHVRTTDRWTVPASVASTGLIRAVLGLDDFPHPTDLKRPARPVPVTATAAVTPAILRSRYQVGDAVSHSPKNTMAVVEFQGQGALQSDLAAFQAANKLEARNYTANGPAPQVASGEGSLDVQYIMAMAQGVPCEFTYTTAHGAAFVSSVIYWAQEQANRADSPWVHSVSYGQGGDLVPDSLQESADAAFKRMGLQGRTVIFASGDSGVGCLFCATHNVPYPALSPYVISVGATQLETGGSTNYTEPGAHFSGGGFGKRMDRPDAQNAAIEAYLAEMGHDLPPPYLYKKTGNRATPDVSAAGVDFQVYINGRPDGVSGTSAAAPTFAGVVALLNDARLMANKPTLGPILPLIYGNMAAFHDVTDGSNGHLCCPGFKAAKGWDPMTGVGTPNYTSLLAVVKALP